MPLLICPNCNTGMTQIQRSEIEIDICPQCRGVWLDRGELEKLLQPVRQYASEERQYESPQKNGYDGHHRDRHEYGHGKSGHYKKSGWQNILDVFD